MRDIKEPQRSTTNHPQRRRSDRQPPGRGKHPLLLMGEVYAAAIFFVISFTLARAYVFPLADNTSVVRNNDVADISEDPVALPPPEPKLDKEEYDRRMLALANIPPVPVATSTATGTIPAAPAKPEPWPAAGTVYPNAGALLPFHRIVAYYGNFYSKQMGVLGEYPADQMIAKLKAEVAGWEVADPTTPVVPAIDYIAVTAQGSAGEDGMYRLRMPDDQIEHAIDLAHQVGGIVFLEVQPGRAPLQEEIEELAPYLKLPEVHLAIDPEFTMHPGTRPGTVIGGIDAADVNRAAAFLAQIVRENHLTPKILIIHRIIDTMLTNAENIQTLPEVQIVIDMDGWGSPEQKKKTYQLVVYDEPVQFAGLKLFYKNDLIPPSTRMLTKEEALELRPRPIFIQYQ